MTYNVSSGTLSLYTTTVVLQCHFSGAYGTVTESEISSVGPGGLE